MQSAAGGRVTWAGCASAGGAHHCRTRCLTRCSQRWKYIPRYAAAADVLPSDVHPRSGTSQQWITGQRHVCTVHLPACCMHKHSAHNQAASPGADPPSVAQGRQKRWLKQWQKIWCSKAWLTGCRELAAGAMWQQSMRRRFTRPPLRLLWGTGRLSRLPPCHGWIIRGRCSRSCSLCWRAEPSRPPSAVQVGVPQLLHNACVYSLTRPGQRPGLRASAGAVIQASLLPA